MHAVWNRATNERLARLGLDFLTSYVGGRGASLGDPAGAVVAAAFAWFEPGLVATVWEAARSAVPPGRLAQADGRPRDAVHCLWWACGLVREHRGDSHVAAAAAAGLDPVEMNILTELWIGMPLLSYTATRGWAPDVMQRAVARLESRGWVRDGAITGEGVAERLSIEQRTDAQEQPIVAALGGRLDEVCSRLNHWGQLCIEAGAFPRDILKRAAG
jgi:hypothetical protein